MSDSFASQGTLKVGDRTTPSTASPPSTSSIPQAARLPFSLKILLENLLRTEDGVNVRAEDIEALAPVGRARPSRAREIAFTPGRVLLQDFTGVPAVVDLAAMRDAMKQMGGDPKKINPLQPAELVIDHSVQVDDFGTRPAFQQQRRAGVRAQPRALRLPALGPEGVPQLQGRAAGHRHRPPGQPRIPGARRLHAIDGERHAGAYPDTLVGTDSHTTMINGLGVLGWGVGGIEAEAAMLGQPVSMLIPQVVGFKLRGQLPEGATATDLVLTVTQMLRKKGVVGKFVEFYRRRAWPTLPLADRATIANMAPEYGATCGIFPVDAETLALPAASPAGPRRSVELVEAYCKEQGLFHTATTPEPVYSDTLELDLGNGRAEPGRADAAAGSRARSAT